MGFPYRTHINTHLGPMSVLYFLLAGLPLILLPFLKSSTSVNKRKRKQIEHFDVAVINRRGSLLA